MILNSFHCQSSLSPREERSIFFSIYTRIEDGKKEWEKRGVFGSFLREEAGAGEEERVCVRSEKRIIVYTLWNKLLLFTSLIFAENKQLSSMYGLFHLMHTPFSFTRMGGFRLEGIFKPASDFICWFGWRSATAAAGTNFLLFLKNNLRLFFSHFKPIIIYVCVCVWFSHK
jgi:hypothetical protein